jgi:hypothetical protein
VTARVRDLERVVDKYLAGGQEFWEFHHAFMDLWVAAELAVEDADHWDKTYELVYMAGPERVMPEDRNVGIIGEAELKSRLSELRRRSA